MRPGHTPITIKHSINHKLKAMFPTPSFGMECFSGLVLWRWEKLSSTIHDAGWPVDTVTRLRVGRQGFDSQLGRDYPSSESVICSRAHQVSCPKGTAASFSGGRAIRTCCWPLSFIQCRDQECAKLRLKSPKTDSWFGASWSTGITWTSSVTSEWILLKSHGC